jgi:hypothetical protein
MNELDAVLPISLGCESVEDLIANRDMFLRDDKVTIQKMAMLALLFNDLD